MENKCCRDFPFGFWEALAKLPPFRCLKAPVGSIEELYEKYYNDLEAGSYAYVMKENTFYAWDTESEIWRPVGENGTLKCNNTDLLMEMSTTVVF